MGSKPECQGMMLLAGSCWSGWSWGSRETSVKISWRLSQKISDVVVSSMDETTFEACHGAWSTSKTFPNG